MVHKRVEEMEKKYISMQEESRIARKIVLVIVTVGLSLFIVTALIGYMYVSSALKPVNSKDASVVYVEIPIGSGVSAIGSILEENGIVKNATIFKYYVKFNNESDFQAGSYDLSPSMTFSEIVSSLKSGVVIEDPFYKIIVPEGMQLVEIAAIISNKTSHDIEEVEEKMVDEDFLLLVQEKYPELITADLFTGDIKKALEGYLYPATYSYYEEDVSVEDILIKMIAQTDLVMSEYHDSMAEKGITVHELLTMSSLIEEEATEKSDRGKISSVFHNRLDVDMPLQTDPTVLYALGEHKARTLFSDLEVDSPYNTYLVRGLPPGPISNAGRSSIEAALVPEETDYYYFLASPDGKVHFSRTLEEHNKKKSIYIAD